MSSPSARGLMHLGQLHDEAVAAILSHLTRVQRVTFAAAHPVCHPPPSSSPHVFCALRPDPR
eukprot:SAG11_NODE_27595_length_331_cov_0.655172_1_plen_61_part_10